MAKTRRTDDGKLWGLDVIGDVEVSHVSEVIFTIDDLTEMLSVARAHASQVNEDLEVPNGKL